MYMQVAESLPVPFHEVDAHNVVPCWIASDKRETGARTIRRKINDKLPEFLEVCLPAWDRHAPCRDRPVQSHIMSNSRENMSVMESCSISQSC